MDDNCPQNFALINLSYFWDMPSNRHQGTTERTTDVLVALRMTVCNIAKLSGDSVAVSSTKFSFIASGGVRQNVL